METLDDFQTTLLFKKEDVLRLRKELTDVFCEIDKSTGISQCFSLDKMKEQKPGLVDLYCFVGGR